MKDLRVSYGMMEVIHEINLEIDSGELVSVIGSNGTGRTMLIKVIIGLVPLHSGSILYDGQDISALSAHKQAEMGIGYIPEDRRVFRDLAVEENPQIGAHRLPDVKQIRPNLQEVYEMFPRLGECKSQPARVISGGERQVPAIGRVLMLSPRLLLINEASMGLMPTMVNICFRIIKELNKSGITILMVEQNVNEALKIANRGHVTEVGNITLESTSEVLRSNDMA